MTSSSCQGRSSFRWSSEIILEWIVKFWMGTVPQTVSGGLLGLTMLGRWPILCTPLAFGDVLVIVSSSIPDILLFVARNSLPLTTVMNALTEHIKAYPEYPTRTSRQGRNGSDIPDPNVHGGWMHAWASPKRSQRVWRCMVFAIFNSHRLW